MNEPTNLVWPRYGKPAPAPGVHGWICDSRDIAPTPEADYHAWSLVSASFLKDESAHRTPMHMRAWLDGDGPKPSKAMAIGSELHEAALDSSYVQPVTYDDSLDMRTADGKAARAEAEAYAEKTSRKIIPRSVAFAAYDMLEAIECHSHASDLLYECLDDVQFNELTATTKLCKARVDRLALISESPFGEHRRWAMIDIKTTRDASSRFFEGEIARRGYHVQTAHYEQVLRGAYVDMRHFDDDVQYELRSDPYRSYVQDGRPIIETGDEVDHYIIAVENSPPFGVCVYRLPDEVVDAGKKIRAERLAAYELALRTDEWPGYPKEHVVQLPVWAMGDDMRIQEVHRDD